MRRISQIQIWQLRWLTSLLSAALGLGLITACASFSRRPLWPILSFDSVKPQNAEERKQALTDLGQSTKSTDPDTRLWASYNLALLVQDSDRRRSCQIFQALTHEDGFVLKDIASLRATIICTQKTTDISWRSLSEKDWWYPLGLQAVQAQGLRDNDHGTLGQVYAAQAKLSPHKNEKITWLKKAIHSTRQAHATTEITAEFTAYQEKLYEISPRHQPHPAPEQWLAVADDYRDARFFSVARDLYQKVIADKARSPQDVSTAWQGLRKTYKLEHDKEAYQKATADFAVFAYRRFKEDQQKNATFYHDRGLDLVRSTWTEGDPAQAKKILRQLEQNLQGHHPLDEIAWLHGRIAEESQNYAESLAAYQLANQECAEKCRLKNQLQWHTAWVLRKLNRPAEASEVLTALCAASDDVTKARCLYWQARTLSEADQPTQAKALWQNLINDYPVSYYGVLAHRELREKFASLKPSRQIASHQGGGSEWLRSEHGLTLSWLLAVGENGLARSLLKQMVAKERKGHFANAENWESIFPFFLRADAFADYMQQVNSLPHELREQLLTNNWPLTYPRPYSQEVAAAATSADVDANFIYAIMRQESAFNPRARSGADALGLMQLIPPVAAKTARSAKIPYRGSDDLFHPATNVALGAAHLRELWQKYQGQPVLVAASYNASERAIRGWIRQYYRGDTIEFIEDIPYEETRNYVKLVFRNWILYKRMQADSAFEFPEWCLQNIQAANF